MSRQQQTIHAAVLHGIGQAPRYERFPAPVPGEGQAVVSVTAAALRACFRALADTWCSPYSADKEAAPDHAPLEFGLLPGADEYAISGGMRGDGAACSRATGAAR